MDGNVVQGVAIVFRSGDGDLEVLTLASLIEGNG